MGKSPAAKMEWEFIAEKLLQAGMFGVVLWSLLFIDFPGYGRLWDKIPAISRPQADDAAALYSPKKADLSQDDGRDRFLISQRDALSETAAAPNYNPTAAELVAQMPGASPTKETGYPKLSSQLLGFDDPRRAAAERTSASFNNAQALPGPAMAGQTPLPIYSMEAPQQDEARPTAVTASGRASGRSEIMGRSAGPVYNLTRP